MVQFSDAGQHGQFVERGLSTRLQHRQQRLGFALQGLHAAVFKVCHHTGLALAIGQRQAMPDHVQRMALYLGTRPQGAGIHIGASGLRHDRDAQQVLGILRRCGLHVGTFNGALNLAPHIHLISQLEAWVECPF